MRYRCYVCEKKLTQGEAKDGLLLLGNDKNCKIGGYHGLIGLTDKGPDYFLQEGDPLIHVLEGKTTDNVLAGYVIVCPACCKEALEVVSEEDNHA